MATPNTTRSGFDDAFTRWNWSATSKRPVGGAHPAFDGVAVAGVDGPIDEESHQRCGVVYALAQLVGCGETEVARICAGGERRDGQAEVLLCFEVMETGRSLGSCGVGVKSKDDSVGEPSQQLKVL